MKPAGNFAQLVGNTPLVLLRGVSARTGCEIYGKAEFMNPGGSVKDRTARFIVEEAMVRGELRAGCTIVEGTAGNTGIGLSLMGTSVGCKTIVVMPENISVEKVNFLKMLGTEVRLVPAKPYKDPENYQHTARGLAEEMNAEVPGSAIWANQFENQANRRAHYETTAPEIWNGLGGKLDGFICAVGTGGTLAGVSRAMRDRNSSIAIGVADPDGSTIYHWARGEELKAEGSSITEGIGNGRVTGNLEGTEVDIAFRIPDSEALPFVYELAEKEGLWVGGSSGVNIAGAVRMAQWLGSGHRIVTILCDTGTRYESKIFNPAFLKERNLPVPAWLDT